MLLAVDIGNTSTKFGIYAQKELLHRFSVLTTEIAKHPGLLDRGFPFTRAIVCSVVPEASTELLTLLGQYKTEAFQVTNDLDLGLTINYEPCSSLGTDRLVNAFAAVEKYGVPAIVCSFGTATTIDVIDKDRVFLGGMIAPGIRTSAEALKLNTAKLPEISIEVPEKLIGNSTASAILSGIVFGHAAMIEGLIDRFKKELGERPIVIATGGFASLIGQMTAVLDKIDPDLTLDGLQMLDGRKTSHSL